VHSEHAGKTSTTEEERFRKQLLSDVDWGEIDYLLVDCAPATDEHLSTVYF
jgi:Mrp family chromosome partitioning ATPase